MALAVLVGACGQSTAADSTEAVPDAEATSDDSASPAEAVADSAQDGDMVASSTTVGATTTEPAEAPTTTTAAPPNASDERPPVLVAGPDGIHLVGDSAQTTLLETPVVVAADDRLGGVVYQVAAGRYFHEPETTIVYWLPANSRDGSPLLVPTGRQWLRLVDVEVIDGATRIVYIRSEGENDPEDFADTLRTYDIVAGEVDEVARVGAWESGPGQVSFGAGTFAVNWFAEALSGFDFFAVDGSRVDVAADPYAGDLFCFDGQMDDGSGDPAEVPAPCAENVSISDDGTEMAYAEFRRDTDGIISGQDLVVVPVDGSRPETRIDLAWTDGMGVVDYIDLVSGYAIVNRRSPETGDYARAVVVDIMTGELTPLELNGQARFTTSIPTP